MPIHPLPVLDEEAEEKARRELQAPKSVVVRYGYMRQIGEFPYPHAKPIGCGTKLVIKTPRGIELGEMLTTTCPNSGCGSSVSRQEMLEYIENSGGKQYPFTTKGKVIRIATREDLHDQSLLEADKPRYVKAAKAAIKDLNLDMKLVDVEPLLGREKIVFYFMAEDRIDFRDLVKVLAAEMHVRIEMRQVGARDEARLVADYEKCGQHCCCKQFLKVLKPISMRSAKIQKATLDPAKISGRCGRLMCCLRYEDQTYDELRKRLPHKKTRMVSDDGPGIVLSTQILTQLVLLELEETGQRNAYPLESLEPYDEAKHGAEARAKQRAEAEAQARAEARSRPKPAESATGDDAGGGTKRKRRRRRRRKKDEGEGDGGPRRPKPGRPLGDGEVESREGERADRVPPQADGDSGSDGGPNKKRRRRRRRRKKGGEGEAPPGPSGD